MGVGVDGNLRVESLDDGVGSCDPDGVRLTETGLAAGGVCSGGDGRDEGDSMAGSRRRTDGGGFPEPFRGRECGRGGRAMLGGPPKGGKMAATVARLLVVVVVVVKGEWVDDVEELEVKENDGLGSAVAIAKDGRKAKTRKTGGVGRVRFAEERKGGRGGAPESPRTTTTTTTTTPTMKMLKTTATMTVAHPQAKAKRTNGSKESSRRIDREEEE